MPDEQQPKGEPRPWGRLFGIRKRVLAAGTFLILLVLAIAREGVVKYGGEFVSHRLKNHAPITVPSQIETGSIIRQELRKLLEAECLAQKAKEITTLTDRRKAAAADHKKCLAEWIKPSWFSDQTADQYCAPKRELYLGYARDLKERDAKDCTVQAPSK